MNRYNRRNRNRNMSGRDRGSGLRTSVRIEDDSGRLIPSIRRKETNTGPVGAHGYGGDSTCDEYQQECSAANGYVSSYTTPPFCSCSSEMAFTYDVMGVDLALGECSYTVTPEIGNTVFNNWDDFTNCVYNNLSTGNAQSYLNQVMMTPMHQDCTFNYQSCLLSVYGGGGFGGGIGIIPGAGGTGAPKGPGGFREGGRISRRGNRRGPNPFSPLMHSRTPMIKDNRPDDELMVPCPDDCNNDDDCHWSLCCNSYGPDNCRMCGYCGGGGGGGPGGPANPPAAPPKPGRMGGPIGKIIRGRR